MANLKVTARRPVATPKMTAGICDWAGLLIRTRTVRGLAFIVRGIVIKTVSPSTYIPALPAPAYNGLPHLQCLNRFVMLSLHARYSRGHLFMHKTGWHSQRRRQSLLGLPNLKYLLSIEGLEFIPKAYSRHCVLIANPGSVHF